MRKLLAILLSALLFITNVSFASAHMLENADPPQFNSFEVFWPMVAGKTKTDGLYFLKRFKEKARGMFIFGLPQKTDYTILIANKRLLESEQLAIEGKDDAAVETIKKVDEELKKSSELISQVKQKQILNKVSPETFGRVENMKKYVEYLISKTHDKVKDELTTTSSTLDGVSSALTN